METLKHKRVESFEIVLEHDIDEQYQYVPGEMMKGVVVITCTELIQVRQLTVSLKGEGNVVWEKDPRSSKKQPHKCSARETYLEYSEDLIRDDTPLDNRTFEAGKHEFVFYCQLSESLPSSYIGKYGSVTYIIKAQLKPERKYGADAMITNEPFLVLRTYDLSLEPFKLQAFEVKHSQPVGGGCFCGGKLSAFIKLNRRAFIPGEDIKVNADVANSSSYEVTSIQAVLHMTTKYHASNSTTESNQVISKHDDSHVIDRGDGRRWNDVRVTIPPYIPESFLEGSDIIDISYTLVFLVILDYNSMPNRNMRIDIPVTIGTHGVKTDDNPTDNADHRPLYSRNTDSEAATLSTRPAALGRPIDDDDEMGEIDTSLFERQPSNRQGRKVKSAAGRDGRSEQQTADLEQVDIQEKTNPVNFLYGDLVAADSLPDNQLQGTVRDPSGNKRLSSKKTRAPQAPELQTSDGEAEKRDEEEVTNEQQTKL